MADIIEFPTAGRPRPLPDSPDAPSALRRGIDRLADAAAALRRSRDGLERQHDVLGTVRGLLEAQALHAQAIAALALSIETAIAADDLSAMIALQGELKSLLSGAADRPRSDAAD